MLKRSQVDFLSASVPLGDVRFGAVSSRDEEVDVCWQEKKELFLA